MSACARPRHDLGSWWVVSRGRFGARRARDAQVSATCAPGGSGGPMQRRYWAPVIAVMMAILVLVPTTLAKGSAGDTYGVAFGTNRFPAGLNTATINLTFVTDD